MSRRDNVEGWHDDWKPQATRNGERWKRLRQLAHGAIEPARTLPEFIPGDFEFPAIPLIAHEKGIVVNDPVTDALIEEGDDDKILALHRERIELRDWILYVTARYGHVGPDDPFRECDHYLNDEIVNAHRFLYLDLINPESITPRWLFEMLAILEEYPGWGLCLEGIPDSDAILYGDRILIAGKLMTCSTVEDLSRAIPDVMRNA